MAKKNKQTKKKKNQSSGWISGATAVVGRGLSRVLNRLPGLMLFLLWSAGPAVLLALTFPRTGWWPLVFAVLVPVLMVVHRKSYVKSTAAGFVFGFTAHMLLFYWIAPTLEDFSNVSTWLAMVILAGSAVFHALPWTLFFPLLRLIREKTDARFIFFAPWIFILFECLVPRVFPWFLGYGVYTFPPLMQVCELSGITGLSFLIVLVSASLADLIIHRDRISLTLSGSAILLVILVSLWGIHRMRSVEAAYEHGKKQSLILVQPNIKPGNSTTDSRHNPVAFKINSMLRAVESGDDLLVVLPETVFTGSFERARNFLKTLAGTKESLFPNAIIFTGANYRDSRGKQNAIVIPGENRGQDQVYGKRILLPFGEYLPFEEHTGFLRKKLKGIKNFVPGRGVREFTINSLCLLPSICYEMLYPAFLRSAMNKQTNAMLNLTDDAWFGPTTCAQMHFQTARFRAIENRVPVIRCANSGISSVIRPTGVPQFTTDTFIKDVRISYIREWKSGSFYSRHGNWLAVFSFIYLLSALILLIINRQSE
mgnify:CR=1 FL=1